MQRTPPGVRTRSRDASASTDNDDPEAGPSNAVAGAQRAPLLDIQHDSEVPPSYDVAAQRDTRPEARGARARQDGNGLANEMMHGMEGIIQMLRELSHQVEAIRTPSRRNRAISVEVIDDGEMDDEMDIPPRPEPGMARNIPGLDPEYGERGAELVPIRARLPRGGWIKNPFDELEFKGKTDKTNPMRFLQKFRRIAAYENVSEEEQLFHFGKCMKGAASQWYELQTAETMEELVQNFTNHFWGCQAQMRFRQRIYFGKYRGNETSMTEYALGMARQAKTLNPPMPDEEIIQTVREHFETDISRELRPSVVRTVVDMVAMLDTIENERETRKLRAESRRGGNNANNEASRTSRNGGSKDRQETRGADSEYRTGRPRDREQGWRNGGRTYGTRNKEHRTPGETRSGGVTIQELPDDDGAKGKPKEATYTKSAGTYYPRQRDASQGRADGQRAPKDAGSQRDKSNRRMAAIAAAPCDDEDCEPEEDEQTESEDERICGAITVEPENDESDGTPITRRQPRVTTRKAEDDVDGSQREISAEKNDVPTIIVDFGGTMVRALIDTGAQISAISRDLLVELRRNKEPIHVLPSRDTVLRGAFSERGSAITSRIRATIRYAGREYTHDYCVVEGLVFETILGIDFLAKYEMSMRCGGKVEINFMKNDNSGSSQQTNKNHAQTQPKKLRGGEIHETAMGRANPEVKISRSRRKYGESRDIQGTPYTK